MTDANTEILILAGGLLLVIILVAALFLMQAFDKNKKQVKNKLNEFQARFGDKGAQMAETRSIRLNQEQTGFGAQLSQLLPNRDQLQIRLRRAGMAVDLAKYALTCGGIAVVTLIFLLLLQAGILLAIFGAIILGFGLPHAYVGIRISKRTTAFTSQFPEAIDLMVRGLKSGLPVNETIANVAKELPAPTGEEFQRITDAMRLGKTLEASLWETAERLDTPDFKFFVISLVVQKETGGNLAETLENLSVILRSRQAMKLKVKALSSEAKASAWIVGALPFIMEGFILVLNNKYAMELFNNPQGQIAAVFGLIWMGIGVAAMAKIVSFEV
jgi:tight adherence protein B